MQGYEEKRVRELLKEHDGVLLRNNKHEVWKLPCGLVVLPSTPSDVRAWKNSLSYLHNALGLNEERGIPGERREKRFKIERPIENTVLEAPSLPDMTLQLRRATAKQIKHPVHKSPVPVAEIQVDLSGLLSKFGSAK